MTANVGSPEIWIIMYMSDQDLPEGRVEAAIQIEIEKAMYPHAASEAVAALHIMVHPRIEMLYSKACHLILLRKTLAAPFLSTDLTPYILSVY